MVHFQQLRILVVVAFIQETFPFPSIRKAWNIFSVCNFKIRLLSIHFVRNNLFLWLCSLLCKIKRESILLVGCWMLADSRQCSQYLTPDYVIFENYYYFIELGTLVHFASFIRLFCYLFISIAFWHCWFSLFTNLSSFCALLIVISTF